MWQRDRHAAAIAPHLLGRKRTLSMMVSRSLLAIALGQLSRHLPSSPHVAEGGRVLLEATALRAQFTATDGHTWVTIGVSCTDGGLEAVFGLTEVLDLIQTEDPDCPDEAVELRILGADELLVAREGAFVTQRLLPAEKFPRPHAKRRRSATSQAIG